MGFMDLREWIKLQSASRDARVHPLDEREWPRVALTHDRDGHCPIPKRVCRERTHLAGGPRGANPMSAYALNNLLYRLHADKAFLQKFTADEESAFRGKRWRIKDRLAILESYLPTEAIVVPP